MIHHLNIHLNIHLIHHLLIDPIDEEQLIPENQLTENEEKKQNNNQQENVNNINENHHKIEQKNDNDNDGYAGFKEPQRHMVNVEQNNNDQIGIKTSLTAVAYPLERQQINT
eukprot:446353_1